MSTSKDQLGRVVRIDQPVNRIISVVPSITELLFDLGLDQKVVGRTKFCIHPKDKVNEIQRVGGTKNLRIEDIIKLKPDIIIANKEENDQAQIEMLANQFPVWISNITTLEESFEMIESLGSMFQIQRKSTELIQNLGQVIYQLKSTDHLKTVYLIWQKPYMTIGHDTYIHDMLLKLGFVNLFGKYTRYPEVSIDDILERSPDIILLSSEPFPFKEKHLRELQSLIPNVLISLADGEAFSWYGSRILHCGSELNAWTEKLKRQFPKDLTP